MSWAEREGRGPPAESARLHRDSRGGQGRPWGAPSSDGAAQWRLDAVPLKRDLRFAPSLRPLRFAAGVLRDDGAFN